MADKYSWQEIVNVPEVSGVYAWYFCPTISVVDINSLISDVKKLLKEDKNIEAKNIVRKFLDSNLFGFFREEPYKAEISGQLKRKYRGELNHQDYISESLVDRLTNEPERLKHIASILGDMMPEFGSPIYMGMSQNLKTRLKRHKHLIIQYREKDYHSPYQGKEPELKETQEKDNGFARQVVNRGMNPTKLFVVIKPISLDGNFVDFENLLNRINYPVLGRN